MAYQSNETFGLHIAIYNALAMRGPMYCPIMMGGTFKF